jgi:hypothetical protein
LICLVACGGDETSSTPGGAGAAGTAANTVSTAGVPAAVSGSGASASTTAAPTSGAQAGMKAITTAGVSAATAGKGGAGTAGIAAVSGGAGGGAQTTAGTTAPAAGSGAVPTEHFSFFVASYAAMQKLSGSPNGFGGDLRFGKADGLSGADEICRQIAEGSMPGTGNKVWHAFLSVTKDASGQPVNAIDRVGEGPWYDRNGRVIAMTKTDLAQTRPQGADSTIINDLPNEDGVPNHAPDGMQVDNHDVLTGSDGTGKLYKNDDSVTCKDWTSSVGSDGRPRVGHSWPRSMGGRGGRGPTGGGAGGAANPAGSMDNWMSALDEAGCGAGASLVEMGGPDPSNPTVGSGGGYGAIYCFALTP